MPEATWWILVPALVATFPSTVSAGDGIVALQAADPSCADDSGNIYVNCGNGTVTDNRTGLVWLQNANCLSGALGGGVVDWFTAMEFTAGLKDISADSAVASNDCGLSDSSSPGEWRLPSVDELEAVMRGARPLGCDPLVTNDRGDGCWGTTLECVLQGRTCSFTDVESSYWSSSPNPLGPGSVWSVELSDDGALIAKPKATTDYVWPVRGGQ